MLRLIESPEFSAEQYNEIALPVAKNRPVRRLRSKKLENQREELSGFQLECGVVGEQALWRAVITQALMDAGSQSTKREARFHRAQATAWLSRRNPDFVMVCTLAGLDVDYVHGKASKAIREGCLWRQKPNERQKNRR